MLFKTNIYTCGLKEGIGLCVFKSLGIYCQLFEMWSFVHSVI